MPFLFLLAPLLFLAVWIIAEAQSSRRLLRVSLGLLTMAGVASLTYFLARFGPNIESGATRSSLRLAEETMAGGDIPRVQQAIHAYNETAASKSTYSASFELWYVLNHGPRASDTPRPNNALQRTEAGGQPPPAGQP